MIGESVGYSWPQQHLGRRPLRKCMKNTVEDSNIIFIDVESDSLDRKCMKNTVKDSNIIFIDVESDSLDNVITIDSPNSLPMKNGDASKRLTRGNTVQCSWKGVILLDDDEDMDDGFVGAGVQSGNNFKNGVSVSIKSNTDFEETPAMSKQTDDEAACSFIHSTIGNPVFMMGDRENLKQTDEYKNALEEEMASRKRALQVQADEAQKLLHLRKRMKTVIELERRKKADEAQKLRHLQNMMKAEAERVIELERRKKADEAQKLLHLQNMMRAEAERVLVLERRKKAKEAQKLLRSQKRMTAKAERVLELEKRKKELEAKNKELERRQKERVDEIRETQKKDANDSNLKEIIRAEVKKNLKVLELMCGDMTSLLRGLGIPVGDGLRPPLSSEVHSAYKKALLAFHPDRSSRTDVRQQVEAEEKFKLISRMKLKFMPA